MDPLRIACIGAWGHLDSVFNELDSTPDAGVKIVALAKALPEEDFSEFRESRCVQGVPVFDDYKKAIRDLRPDIAVISTRLDRITPIAIDAANAGCHLVCEKPLALTHESLQLLAMAVQKNNVQCIAMIGNRVNPVLAAARKVVESGIIGEVVLANARKSYKWGTRPEWFGNRSIYGGSIGWIGIHGLDFIHTVTAQDFTSVAAMHSNRAHPERPECEDNAVLILKLANGGHATLTMDFFRPKAASTHGNDSLRIVGTKGVLEADMSCNKTCLVTTNDQPERAVPLGPTAPYYADFYHHLRRGDKHPPADMCKGFYLTHVGLCARDAADQNKVVAIPPFAI